MQFLVREGAHVPGFPFPNQRCLVGLISLEMTVEAVVREVGCSSLKPARKGWVVPVEDGVKRFEPMQFTTRRVPPEAVGIGLGRFSESAIGLHPRNSRIPGEVRWWIKDTLLLKHALDGRTLTHPLPLKCTDSTTLSMLSAS